MFKVVDPRDADDIARAGLLDVDALEAGERQQGRKPKAAGNARRRARS